MKGIDLNVNILVFVKVLLKERKGGRKIQIFRSTRGKLIALKKEAHIVLRQE